MRWSRSSVVALAALGVLGVLAPGTAGAAAPDRTPPRLVLPGLASFVTGTSIGPMSPLDGGPQATDGIVMTASWRATDASGICGYSTREVYAGMEPSSWTAWGPQTSLTASVTDYDSQFGGGSFKLDDYEVRVRDCVGNITVRSVSVRPGVFQQDGTSFGYGTLAVTYTGSWGDTTCVCWSGGTARRTSAKGAAARFALTFPEAHPVALVMEKAPGRGKAQVLVDGVVKATVDTLADPTQHRTVVWSGTVPAGSHTVGVVDLATPGRPRVDVDALVVSGLSA